MRITVLLLALALAVGAAPIHAQPLERVLIPIVVKEEIPGAYGSRWTTTLTGFNGGASSYYMTPPPTGYCWGCDGWSVDPGTTFSYPVSRGVQGRAVFVFVRAVENGTNPFVHFHLRLQDVSRQAQTWGTEVPVIRERDVLSSATQILDVPMDARFRVALRIMDFDEASGRRVRCRFFDYRSGALLHESEFALVVPDPYADPGYSPGEAAVLDLAGAISSLRSAASVRIELIPDPGLRFWAFVSVTNNETQHVTLITPERLE
jgi:hypothetical protein